MEERVPSARALGVVELPGLSLAFHKRSNDGSGKCLLYTSQGIFNKAYGVLYAFDPTHKAELDAVEGNGKGYFEEQVSVPLNGLDYLAFIYRASSTYINASLSPYHWYKNLVLAGACFHNFPPEYVSAIDSVVSVADPDTNRRQQNEELLRRMGWV